MGVTLESAQAAANAISQAMASQVVPVEDFGYIVTPMIDRGIELFVGATNDPIFGPSVIFGSGGVLLEALKYVTLGPLRSQRPWHSK